MDMVPTSCWLIRKQLGVTICCEKILYTISKSAAMSAYTTQLRKFNCLPPAHSKFTAGKQHRQDGQYTGTLPAAANCVL